MQSSDHHFNHQKSIMPSPAQVSVLVADDNYATQKLTAMILKKNGYTVMTAANGIEVLTILSQQQFDIILMDCNMPQMNGVETTKKIRQEHAYNSIRIIATSPAIKNLSKELCLINGMDDYLPKPITKDLLLACINKWHRTITATS